MNTNNPNPSVCPSCGAIRKEEPHSRNCGWTRRHEDQAPRYQHRPTPRRQTTRRMAVTAALREA